MITNEEEKPKVTVPRRSSLKFKQPTKLDPNAIMSAKPTGKFKRNSVSWGKSNTFEFKSMKAMFTESEDINKKETEEDKEKRKKFLESRKASIKNEFSLLKEMMKKTPQEIIEEENDEETKENMRKNLQMGKEALKEVSESSESSHSGSKSGSRSNSKNSSKSGSKSSSKSGSKSSSKSGSRNSSRNNSKSKSKNSSKYDSIDKKEKNKKNEKESDEENEEEKNEKNKKLKLSQKDKEESDKQSEKERYNENEKVKLKKKKKVQLEDINQQPNSQQMIDKQKDQIRQNPNNIKEKKNHLKEDEFIKLDDTINELEQFNAKKILKGDLYNIYNDLIKENLEFKDDIFFVNLNYFENKVGNCDDRKISHSYKEYPKSEYFKEYLPSRELLKKYENKANKIIDDFKI